MKKTAKALAIIATAILLLCGLGLLFLYLIDLIKFGSFNFLDMIRALPVTSFIYIFLWLVIGGVLCFTVCSKKTGIGSDIVMSAMIVVAGPMIMSVANQLWYQLLRGFDIYYGTALVSYSFGSGLISSFVNVAKMMLLVACGMSIAYKHLTRKQEKALSASSGEQIFPDAVQNP